LEELVSGLLRPKLFPFGKLSKAKPAAQYLRLQVNVIKYNFFVDLVVLESVAGLQHEHFHQKNRKRKWGQGGGQEPNYTTARKPGPL
jgi:hypothetical protein